MPSTPIPASFPSGPGRAPLSRGNYHRPRAEAARAAYPSFAAPKAAQWKIKTRLQPQDAELGLECDLSPVTIAILRARGFDSISKIREFLTPSRDRLRDPMNLPDMDKAVARLQRALIDKEAILIFGDYDVDGVASTAMLKRALTLLGANVRATVPERSQGYGLSVRVVEKAHRLGFGLIVTVDNGVRAFEAVERARELGLDVIVTDHHEPDGVRLPPALAVVNPKRLDSSYGFRELCGCAVAFKLMQALLAAHWPRFAAGFEEKYVEFVALATVADCMPLEDENRVLTRDGLRRLANTRKHGLQSLMEVSRLQVAGDSLTGRHVGWNLAPRLNAAGRFDEAAKSLKLLLTTDGEEAARLAGELEAHNRERQGQTQQMTREAFDMIGRDSDLDKDCAIVLAGDGWSRGLLGLVASRLVERFNRPALVLGIHDGRAGGSGRSIGDFDLSCIFEAARDLILEGGGHAGACGVHIDAANVDVFRDKVLCCAGERLQVSKLVPTVEADCVVQSEDLSEQLVRDLAQLEPCGHGNKEALLVLENVEITDGRSMGADGVHLKWRVQSGQRSFDAVWWRPGERAIGFGLNKRVDLCFVPELNTYGGKTTLQLNIREARLSP